MNDTLERPGADNFDFLIGRWQVRHRRLKRRLQGSDEWETFSGTSVASKLLGGHGNIDDNLIELPAGAYRAATLRAWDPGAGQWSIWWLDGRWPGRIEAPMRGAITGGVGRFFADDTFEGRPIQVRFLWSDIGAASARWQQAFSADGGKTWENNWVMDFDRLA
jgi:hypothetical protein